MNEKVLSAIVNWVICDYGQECFKSFVALSFVFWRKTIRTICLSHGRQKLMSCMKLWSPTRLVYTGTGLGMWWKWLASITSAPSLSSCTGIRRSLVLNTTVVQQKTHQLWPVPRRKKKTTGLLLQDIQFLSVEFWVSKMTFCTWEGYIFREWNSIAKCIWSGLSFWYLKSCQTSIVILML